MYNCDNVEGALFGRIREDVYVMLIWLSEGI